ncbi:MAG: holdfast anchoring protein HfaB, partial [Caulobacteraceae bacterium]
MSNNKPFNIAKRVAALLATSCLGLSACATPVAGPSGLYARPIGNSTVVANPTPYSAALVCLAEYARAHNVNAPRVAIGRIGDYTGKLEADGSGRKLTQGASLMAMTAFAKAGVPLVERYDTSVSEMELKYANAKLISDHPTPGGESPAPYREIEAGQVPGSDFYVVG